MSGFQIFTPGLIPELTFASYGFNGAGWIMATDVTGARVDIHGEITRAPVVPIPAAVWLFGTGLLGLIGVARRKKA